MKLYPPLLKFMGIKGLMDVAQSKMYSVSYSPFGWEDNGGTVVVKRAVPWKFAEEADLPSDVKSGLSSAKKISGKHTEKGVVLVNIRGRLKRMPAKSAAMMKDGKRSGDIVAIIPA